MVPLPGDIGLWDALDLTLEPGHASLVHCHRLWVGVELGKC